MLIYFFTLLVRSSILFRFEDLPIPVLTNWFILRPMWILLAIPAPLFVFILWRGNTADSNRHVIRLIAVLVPCFLFVILITTISAVVPWLPFRPGLR